MNYELMLRTDVLARVCDALALGFEPAARVRGRWRALPQVFRPRARGSKPSGSASQTRASTSMRNISYELRKTTPCFGWGYSFQLLI